MANLTLYKPNQEKAEAEGQKEDRKAREVTAREYPRLSTQVDALVRLDDEVPRPQELQRHLVTVRVGLGSG